MEPADSSQARAAAQSRRACQECNRKKTKCDMKRPTCGLCQRTGNVCTVPTKRKAPDSRKPSARRQTSRFSDNLDRLIDLLQTQSASGDKLQDFLSVHSNSSAEAHSPGLSTSPTTGGENNSRKEYSGHLYMPEAEGPHGLRQVRSLLSTLLRPDAPESTPKPVKNAKLSFILPPAVSISLIDVFFEKIQPWLPMLHRPRFLARYAGRLNSSSHNSQSFLVDEALLLYGIFALAARFSSSEFFGDTLPIQRGNQFLEEAKSLYDQARAISTPTLTYLQGCVLLAFYYYTSEPCPQSWILTGVCVRIAYELDLADIDADDTQQFTRAEWVEREEMRRAWWLVWELDTFGSSVSNRPYTIDRRRMEVMLPVSDEAWFSETPQSSIRLNTCPGQSWKSLQGCDKLDERAWFLFANYLMSLTVDMSNRKDGISADDKLTLENEINCFKLSLPASFRLETELLTFDPESFARSNWIIGTNLMLMTTSVFLSSLKVAEIGQCSPDDPTLNTNLPLRIRAMELSRIVNRWSPGYISLSHPFLAASIILPMHLSGDSLPNLQPVIASSRELGKRLLAQFGEVWELGSVLLRLATILESSRKLSSPELRLARRFAVFFPQSVKNASITDLRHMSAVSQQVLGNDQPQSQHDIAAGAEQSQLLETVAAERNSCSWNVDAGESSIPITTQASMIWNHENPSMDFSFVDFFSCSEG